jgi:hypothetical protein
MFIPLILTDGWLCAELWRAEILDSTPSPPLAQGDHASVPVADLELAQRSALVV